MHIFGRKFPLRALFTAFFMLSMVPFAPLASAQSAPTSFTNEEFGYTVEWTDDWAVDPASLEDGVVSLSRNDAMYLTIIGADASEGTPQELVSPGRSDVVLEDHSDEESPWVLVDGDVLPVRYQAYSINGGDASLFLIIQTSLVFQEQIVEYISSEVTVNGTLLLAGDPIAESGTSTDLTGNADETPDATEETGSTGVRTTRNTDETPVATEETGSTGVRTTRNTDETPVATEETGSTGVRTTRNADETPEATEAPTEEVVTEDGLETFTGPVYGYSISYNPTVWTLDAELEDDGMDGVRLVSDTSTYTIWAWDGYGNDPAACLDGEADFYGTQIEEISDFEPIIGSDGEELRYESDNLAWGVFSLNYTTEAGDEYPLIDYISCEPIPGEDAVLMILLSSDPEPYNDNLDLALDVLDTLQFADAGANTGTADPTETPAETPEDNSVEIDTNLDGSLYTSPNYGFTVNVPLQWNVIDETSTSTNEQLIVSNGTSEVMIWATSEYSGDLEGCVDFAADASGLDLQLDSNSSGGDFRGTARGESFANFVYEGDGGTHMYFVNCRAIDGTDGFLIITQDVEYDLFASERRFRSEIENSIVMP